MWNEFKQFLTRGNVVDLAVGIIIGTAFGKVISSFVSDILMPPIGALLGKADFSSLFIDLSGKGYESLEAAKVAGAPTINYGLFINSLIDFVIIGAAIFLVVKTVVRFRQKQAKAPVAEPPAPTATEKLLTEIRDLLRRSNRAA